MERDEFGRLPITPVPNNTPNTSPPPSPPPLSPPQINRRNVGGRRTITGRGVIPTTGGRATPRQGSIAPLRQRPLTEQLEEIPTFQELQPRREQRIRMAVVNERARRRRGSLAPKDKGNSQNKKRTD